MSSYMDMSLDDIIKKKREETRAKRIKVRPQLFRPVPKMAPIMDARHTILSKNRSRITDAREKITQLAKQKDARLKLNKLRQERASVPGPFRNTFLRRTIFTRAPPASEIVFADSSRQVKSRALATATATSTSRMVYKRQTSTQTFNEARSTGKPRLFEFQHRPKPRPLPQTAVGRDLQIIGEAPVHEEYVPQPLSTMKRKPSVHFKIVAEATDGCSNEVSSSQRTVVANKMTPQMPPQLKPISNKLPMATQRSDTIAQNKVKPRLEYRIIVSNLNPTVIDADIQELFGDVGVMMESRLVRPGIAEVIYQTQHDAQTAVDLYHNRHLDGQPMNCLLVTPRVPFTAASSSYTSRPAYHRANLDEELDISTLHKVLFRK